MPGGPGSGPSSSAGGGDSAAAYDPLAAMMAPPARRMPTTASYSAAADLDPLAAMMAPPSRSYGMPSNPSFSAGGGAPPSTINMWKPAPQPVSMSGGSPFLTVQPSAVFPPQQSVSLSLSDNDNLGDEFATAPSAAAVGSEGNQQQQGQQQQNNQFNQQYNQNQQQQGYQEGGSEQQY